MGQTFLSALFADISRADRNVCPTVARSAGWPHRRRGRIGCPSRRDACTTSYSWTAAYSPACLAVGNESASTCLRSTCSFELPIKGRESFFSGPGAVLQPTHSKVNAIRRQPVQHHYPTGLQVLAWLRLSSRLTVFCFFGSFGPNKQESQDFVSAFFGDWMVGAFGVAYCGCFGSGFFSPSARRIVEEFLVPVPTFFDVDGCSWRS